MKKRRDTRSPATVPSAVLPPAPAMRTATPPQPLQVSSGALEALKWLAVGAMVIDHVNKYLLHGSVPAMFSIGRLALPIFAFVLGHHLARADADAGAMRLRLMGRLAAAAAVATLPYVALGGLGWGWWPANILTTFLLATAVMHGWSIAHPLARVGTVVLFAAGGALVEFWWPGVACVLASAGFVRRPGPASLALLAAVLACLPMPAWFLAGGGVSLDMSALAGLPLVALVRMANPRVPRLRWVFYAIYPAHLAILWLLRSA